jgi:hypothetical protein
MPHLFHSLAETIRRRRRTAVPADLWMQAQAAVTLDDPTDVISQLLLIAWNGQGSIARTRGNADPAVLEVTDAVMTTVISRVRAGDSSLIELFGSLAESLSEILTNMRRSNVYDQDEAARLVAELNG